MASHIVKDQVKCSWCRHWKPSISAILKGGKIFCRRCARIVENWDEYQLTLK